MDDQIKCPKCRSAQVTANKKGFNGTNAVAGAIIAGGYGLLAGTIGSNKVIITCLSCGYTFNPGDKPFLPVEPVVFKWSTVFGLLGVIIPFLLIFFLALHFLGFLASIVLGGIYLFILKIILTP